MPKAAGRVYVFTWLEVSPFKKRPLHSTCMCGHFMDRREGKPFTRISSAEKVTINILFQVKEKYVERSIIFPKWPIFITPDAIIPANIMPESAPATPSATTTAIRPAGSAACCPTRPPPPKNRENPMTQTQCGFTGWKTRGRKTFKSPSTTKPQRTETGGSTMTTVTANRLAV